MHFLSGRLMQNYSGVDTRIVWAMMKTGEGFRTEMFARA
jgi:hypothetical protein